MSDEIQKNPDQPSSLSKASAPAGESVAESAAESVVEAPPAPHPWHQRLIDEFSAEAVTDCIVNERNGGLVTITIAKSFLPAVAEFLKQNADFQMDYCRNVSGSDLETHLEVAYYLHSLPLNKGICIKAKTDRDTAELPSLTPIWATGNWNEREIFDLLGVNFVGHPDMRRIMMPDDWVGYPLRKDYVPIDPEV